ncbi:MAG TPA: glycosyl hydrolase family 18 protein [Flavisolibacter sp.]|nr:glycosyl hydrolase family 18 protein [Flavisolibacter sp.]
MHPRFFLFLFTVLFASGVAGQSNHQQRLDSFRVVGYYFLRAALSDTQTQNKEYPFLDHLTHLNIAFINPDSNGNFQKDLLINDLIEKAHAKGVKVLASIAGGGSHAYYSTLLYLPKRKKLVSDLTEIVLKNNLDGVDVDLEGGDIDENYEPFVTELAVSLKKHNRLITSAIASAYKDQLTDQALKQFDFINLMSYDATGPWRPQDAGPHAPYEMAVRDLDYWIQTRSLPKQKVNLGLPFYGYVFGAPTSPVTSMTYGDIIATGRVQHEGDTLQLPGGTVVYFNGAATIKAKTTMAANRAGGVMIWQILGDADGTNSLLELINKTVERSRKKR